MSAPNTVDDALDFGFKAGDERAHGLHLAHSGHQVDRRYFDDPMEVIAHQALSMHLPACFLASFAQRGNKPQAVGVIAKNVLPLVPTAHNLVNRTRNSIRNGLAACQ